MVLLYNFSHVGPKFFTYFISMYNITNKHNRNHYNGVSLKFLISPFQSHTIFQNSVHWWSFLLVEDVDILQPKYFLEVEMQGTSKFEPSSFFFQFFALVVASTGLIRKDSLARLFDLSFVQENYIRRFRLKQIRF